MRTNNHTLILLALVAALLAAGSTLDTAMAERNDPVDGADAPDDDNDSDDSALDDGKALLSKAKLSFEDAKAAARKAAPGDVAEIDLEYWNDKLVFDVDMGAKTVCVDAVSGEIVSVTEKDATSDQD